MNDSPVVASRTGTAQTSGVARRGWGCGTATLYANREQNTLENVTTDGDSPVCEAKSGIAVSLSNAGHEESCANLPGPSGKAKYSRETDSERVL